MSFAPALLLREGDRDRLADLARLPSVPPGLAKRARMVLLAADGMPNAEIARTVGVSRPTVISWRDRYQAGGIKALDDEPRSRRPGWGSRTGRPGSWPRSWESRSHRWPGSGASGASPLTAWRPSSSAPTR